MDKCAPGSAGILSAHILPAHNNTKPTLLLEMVKAVHADGRLPFRWLTGDEEFGRDTAFLDQVGDYVWYFAEVDQDTRVGWQRPQTAVPDWSGRGASQPVNDCQRVNPKLSG